MDNACLKMHSRLLLGLMITSTIWVSSGFTDSQDAEAIVTLFIALGSPEIPGWTSTVPDPCGGNWQGVQCVGPNITEITLHALTTTGNLGNALDKFSALITLDLSNNGLTGDFPENLPPHLQRLFLAANQLTGSIPSTLGSLNLLTDVSLNNNLLTGLIPDSFQALTGIINLDLSANNLSGQLPASFEDLSSLTTLRLQSNQLSGTLEVLQDLPLKDLNVENNLFSGPVPSKLLTIPTLKMDGNPFNTTSPTSPSSPPSPAPASLVVPHNTSEGPSGLVRSDSSSHSSGTKFFTPLKIIGLAAALMLLIVAAILGVFYCASYCKDKEKRHAFVSYKEPEKKSSRNDAWVRDSLERPKVVNESVEKEKNDRWNDTTRKNKNLKPPAAEKVRDDYRIDMPRKDVHLKPPPVEKVIPPVIPKNKPVQDPKPKTVYPPVGSVACYTISDLQQYTGSFQQENLIGEGSLGTVYLAELPSGKHLAVKKLDPTLSQSDQAFLNLVSNISKLCHPNITKLVGYCAEHGQRILVYEYCSNGSLYDALHFQDTDQRPLSWNARIKIALGAAHALDYLHEACQPPVVHRNFKSSNLLLDDEMCASLSDCGLASLFSSCSAAQVASHMLGSFSYAAPEFNMSGVYNIHSDVYSFGVVMLELLTGRKALDRSRPRAEQSLVRWASPKLHDIDALSRMVDPGLGTDYPVKSLSRFADIISLCVQPEPEFRPPISEIVQALQRMLQTEPTRRSDVHIGSRLPELLGR